MGHNWFLTALPMLFGVLMDLSMSGWTGPRPALPESVHRKVWWIPTLLVSAGAGLVAFVGWGSPLGVVGGGAFAVTMSTLWFSPSRSTDLPPPGWVLRLRARTLPAADEMHFWRLNILVIATVGVAVGAAVLL